MRLSASEPHARTVWLVLVRRVGVAWGEEAHVYAATTNWRNADSHYQGAVADSHEQGGTHVVQLVPWLTTADPRSLIGGTISGQVPAAREFRP